MSGKAVKDIGKVLVSEEVEQALDIEAKARKRDKQEILREVMTADASLLGLIGAGRWLGVEVAA